MLVGDLEPSISVTALQGERRTYLCLEGISEAHGLLKFRGLLQCSGMERCSPKFRNPALKEALSGCAFVCLSGPHLL